MKETPSADSKKIPATTKPNRRHIFLKVECYKTKVLLALEQLYVVLP